MVKHFKNYIEILNQGHFRHDRDVYDAFCLIADGEVDTEHLKEFLLKINETGIDDKLLYGAAKLLNERSIKLKAPADAIDVCGTGGDKLDTLNISTAVSFVVASLGVPVAKHGNKAVSSASGSADIFAQLGIQINKSSEEVEQSLELNNLAFIFAPLYHPALKHVAQARQELATKTIFNYLGPLLNPAKTKYQLIGCSDRRIAKDIATTLARLKKKKCWVVYGLDGMDEITTTDDTLIYKMEDGQVAKSEIFNPEEYGIKKSNLDDLKGGDPEYNAQKMLELFQGKKDSTKLKAYYDIVCVNCAAALIIAGKAEGFKDGIAMAQAAIDDQKAYELLKTLSSNKNL